MLPSVHWVAYTKNKKQETYSLKSLQRALVFPFFLTDERTRELGPFIFFSFQWTFILSWQDDVLSDAYSCVIEHLQSCLLWLHSRAMRGDVFTNLNVMQMSKSISNSVVPVVPKGFSDWDMPYVNKESLSILTPLILWKLHKLLTIELSAPSLQPQSVSHFP